jgi:hypothetical protein
VSARGWKKRRAPRDAPQSFLGAKNRRCRECARSRSRRTSRRGDARAPPRARATAFALAALPKRKNHTMA